MAVVAVFEPWIYLVGGRLRLLPIWNGQGDVLAPSGHYRIHLWFYPWPSRHSILPSNNVLGSGYICTPKGERYSLRVNGGTNERVWRDMEGQFFRLAAYHRPANYSFSNPKTWYPRLSFSGHWVGADLVMNDEGSIVHAFLPDGSLNIHATTWGAKPVDSVPITLIETGLWQSASACQNPAN